MMSALAIRETQLELLAERLAVAIYPGYPERADRFHAVGDLGKLVCNGHLIKDGPWHYSKKQEQVPDAAERQTLRDAGYLLDGMGRPLHPWLHEMVTNPDIGVVTGRGAYWYWGPNYTADSAIIHGNTLLMIQRRDTGTWALPGGHLDPGESAAAAAQREVLEETGVDLTGLHGELYYEGPVADLRTTAHAWPETQAFLFRIATINRPIATGADDAIKADWIPFEELGNLDLFGSHRLLAQLALEAAGATSTL